MSAHTPGPWSFEHNSWAESSIYAGGRQIAVFCIDDEADEETQDKHEAEKDANIVIAAAAPELYAACEAAIAYDDAIAACGNDPRQMSSFCTAQGDTLDSLYEDWIRKSTAALARARGES